MTFERFWPNQTTLATLGRFSGNQFPFHDVSLERGRGGGVFWAVVQKKFLKFLQNEKAVLSCDIIIIITGI